MSLDKDKGLRAALERMLTTLDKKVDPSYAALIVIDMQNDFLASGGMFDKLGVDISPMRAIVPALVNLIDRAREVGLPIIHIQAIYASENNWYLSDVYLEQAKRRANIRNMEIDYPVCEKGSWGADFYTGIKPLPVEAVVQKHRWSAFVNTDLDTILRSKGIRTLIMTGVATNICVESTVRDGFMKDYYIVFVKDCIAAYSEELHNNTLTNIALFFGEVVDSSDVIRCWAKSR